MLSRGNIILNKNIQASWIIKSYSTVIDLKTILKEQIPIRKNEIQKIKKNYGNKKIDEITINSLLGGMRGNRSMFWRSTSLDPNLGIKFHGLTIEDCQKNLPKLPNTYGQDEKIFLPETMLWLLITGEVPTVEQAMILKVELAKRGRKLPDYVDKVMSTLPKDLHPMTQFAIGIATLNKDSQFRENYEKGSIGKADYWESTYEDTLNLIALLPQLAGKVYSNSYNNGQPLGQFNENEDWSYNICSLLGMTNTSDSMNIQNFDDKKSQDFVNLMRLYTGIHVDHEGGNVSAHATHLVGSALSDAYLSYSSGIMGLAGPLHGLAAQEVVRFLIAMNSNISSPNDKKSIKDYLWSLLNSHKVIPGYGHAVLRQTDPRWTAMVDFAKRHPEEFENDKNVMLMQNLVNIAPGVLKEHGKTANPYPNVDAASGILFYHYGVRELLFFTVIFGCSRALGPLSQLVWDRGLGLPIERPKSLDLKSLKEYCD
ncbi:hypothetical protein TBLA_0C05230 [Henningerozyma blattae CBS 6284]|uniref:Citrate synthase n=1 Tax=Henningerozyma blattae (strain ATCC 34711 / CBS 6284 / DSM 70876 / NBRC 10599 / NRRL Y-10934 / UCD 77-7) TaxID=1071380 RepID=I2H1R7_HENB6|nr:hypothetical protein TBLA_0C05230 [Tetrapisispora blattae CBS 6284]CCH60319.1 hypothetical protein TBLA_0C05230 [Tetrapisispora blattae CBS 6284]